MRIRKRRMRWGRSEIAQGVDQWIGIFLAIVICFFALQQSYGVQNMYDITQAEPDHLAVHTMERQQGSFLDILGRSELTQFEQARLTVRARVTRLNAERNIILWAGLASGFAGNATRIYLASCRTGENAIIRSGCLECKVLCSYGNRRIIDHLFHAYKAKLCHVSG